MAATALPPASTYRVQLSSNFTLRDLANRVPYLADLGITDVYLSPIYAARPGTTHGYDVVDHTAIDPELGGDDGWRQLCGVLRAHSMGVVFDVVPNHMAADPVHNILWRQMLAEGPTSAAARHFDVDWRPLTGLIRDKVLLPVLEEPYGLALLNGKVALEESGTEYRVRCGGLHLPVAAGTLRAEGAALEAINADPQQLHAVLEEQHYRLAYWRAANDEINYRRFFDVNELIALRAEAPEVFRRSHELIVSLAQESGVVHGLRVDHVDGLLDPTTYLQRLRAGVDEARGSRTWVVVEKILERTETLDELWPVDGTTGYDALNVLNRLFVSGRGVRVLRHFYQRMTGHRLPFRDIAYQSKRLIMDTTLRSGLTLLAHAFKRVADASWTTRDLSLHALTVALVELIASLAVYRTYLGFGSERHADRDAVEEASASAIRRNPSTDPSALIFLRDLLFDCSDPDPVLSRLRCGVVQRLQQYTSSVQAKGVEDTAYYRDNTLIALNEVGGDPARASGSIEEFHRFNQQRARRWPDAQTSTSTHDTKLGEDSRIRIASLSAFATDWVSAVRAWRQQLLPVRRSDADDAEIDLNDEYRFYQALIGIWPGNDAVDGSPADSAIVDRMTAYMQKAAREARIHTSWMQTNAEYETALDRFVRASLTGDSCSEFRASFRSFVRTLLPLSELHSISQLVLKCLMPGVPDVYQGNESWCFCLTDPDNRRPVDFDRGSEPADLKRLVAAALLRFRRDHRVLMAQGAYTPIRAHGHRASAVIAFRRSHAGEHVVVAVPRLLDRVAASLPLSAGPALWSNTEVRLPPQVSKWTNVLSNRSLTVDGSRVHLSELAPDHPWLVVYGQS